MVDRIRGLDSGNFAEDPRAYRQGIDPLAAQLFMDMVKNNQLPGDVVLPQAQPIEAKTQAAANVVELFSRNRLET